MNTVNPKSSRFNFNIVNTLLVVLLASIVISLVWSYVGRSEVWQEYLLRLVNRGGETELVTDITANVIKRSSEIKIFRISVLKIIFCQSGSSGKIKRLVFEILTFTYTFQYKLLLFGEDLYFPHINNSNNL